MCGNSILSCCPHNPHGHEQALKEEEKDGLFMSMKMQLKLNALGELAAISQTTFLVQLTINS